MERHHPHHAHDPADEPLDAVAHLLRGLVRERDREDLRRLGLAGRDQVGDAVRQHAGLARAGAGQHQQRAAAVRDRLALRRVEALEQPLARGASRSRGLAAALSAAWAPLPAGRVLALVAAQRPHLGRLLALGAGQVGDRALELADPLGQALAARRRPGPAGAASRCPGPPGWRPSTRTGWPGLPTTVEFGGTSWITTEFAPTFAPCPTVIGPSSFAPEPIVTLSSTVGWRLPRREAGAAERHALDRASRGRRSRPSRRSRRRCRGR